MTRKELIVDKEYILAGILLQLLNLVESYMAEKGILTISELAKSLNIPESKAKKIINLDYNPRLSEMIELALAMGKVLVLHFVDINDLLDADEKDMKFELTTKNI